MSRLLILKQLPFLLLLVLAQELAGQNCISQTSCDTCLDTEGCSWCIGHDYNETLPRCMPKPELINMGCPEKFIQQSSYMEQTILKDDPLSDFLKNELDARQISPQHVKLKMKKGTTQEINMKFRAAKNYPLDLYYLMDLTWSMKDDKETLVKMGGDLANALNNLTENNRLGFGSFADKPTIPYIMISDKEKENPCAVEQNTCAPTYLFKHHLSLTSDINQFVKEVDRSVVTGNVDNLEGGLEALMQVLVCDEWVGWKSRSRKIVVFASDGWQHVAGFGLLGGSIKKNDKECHINIRGDYTSSLFLDYPSLEEIYHELVQKKVNVIFAVTHEVLHHYKSMKKLMPDQTNVGILQEDSSNILELVEEGFTEFVRKVHFIDNAPSYFKIEYLTTCGGKYSDYVSQSTCDNIKIGEEYDFKIRVTLNESPDNIGLEKQTIRIEESSLSDEALQIDIELQLNCPCMAQDTGSKNSPRCHRNGEFKCGMCLCNDGFIGKTCDCDLRNYNSSKELDDLCRLEEYGFLHPSCFDHGECLCGKCYCDEGFEGPHCQCLKCLKDKQDGSVCSNHGTCDCGKCKCDDGWSGENCDCPTTKLTCTAPGDEVVCSGQGECLCGQCECKPTYRGQFCERTGGTSSLCKVYNGCVESTIYRKLRKTSDMENCTKEDGTSHTISFVDELPNQTCYMRIYHEDTVCEYYYSYEVDKSGHTTLSVLDQECPPTNYAMFGFITVVIATLIIGLVVLCCCWICVRVKDRREYARFEQEQKEKTRFSLQLSPLYKSPITEYQVPQFTFPSVEQLSFPKNDSLDNGGIDEVGMKVTKVETHQMNGNQDVESLFDNLKSEIENENENKNNNENENHSEVHRHVEYRTNPDGTRTSITTVTKRTTTSTFQLN